MKFLLILLILIFLVCSMAMNGQCCKKEYIYTVVDDHGSMELTDSLHHLTVECLLCEWKLYNQECYADSTLIHRQGSRVYMDEETGIGYDDLVNHHWTEWIHREPSPSDFMEFLKRKYEL